VSFLRHLEIYRSDERYGKPASRRLAARRGIVTMSFRLDIPWRVGLHQSLPLLLQLLGVYNYCVLLATLGQPANRNLSLFSLSHHKGSLHSRLSPISRSR
jgi:hypothetical protein